MPGETAPRKVIIDAEGPKEIDGLTEASVFIAEMAGLDAEYARVNIPEYRGDNDAFREWVFARL